MNPETAEQPPASVLGMAAPLVVSFWMRAAVTLVDTVFAATLGDAAVAAIGLTVPLEFLMIAAWVGLSTGATSALSRAMGARENAQVEQYLRIGWRLVWMVAPLFLLAGAGVWFVAPWIGLEPGVARAFQVYGSVMIVGSSVTTFWSVIPNSVIKAHHDTRSTMWAGIWSNLINLGLNSLFLFVFGWGLFGIALSTVLGRLGGLAYAIVRARQHETRRRAAGPSSSDELDPRPYRAFLRLAIPSSLTFGLMAAESGLINALLTGMQHATEAIAAYSIYYRVVLFALQPVIATSVAMLPFAARRFGERDLAGVRAGLRQANLAATLYAIVLVAPFSVWSAPLLADWLTESSLTARYATFALRTIPLACLTGSLFLLCRPVFEGMQRGRPGLWMAVLRYVVLTGPLAWLGMYLASRFDQPRLYGLIVGTLVASAISSAVFYGWLRRTLPDRV